MKIPFDYYRRLPFKKRHGRCLIQRPFGFGGVTRPFALVPDFANQMQNGTYQTVQTDRIQTGVVFVDKKAGAMLEMNWYMTQMDLIGQGKQPNPKLSAWKVLLKTLWENGKAGLSTGRS